MFRAAASQGRWLQHLPALKGRRRDTRACCRTYYSEVLRLIMSVDNDCVKAEPVIQLIRYVVALVPYWPITSESGGTGVVAETPNRVVTEMAMVSPTLSDTDR